MYAADNKMHAGKEKPE